MGRKGNPNWGKALPLVPVVPTVTSFEEAVKELKLRLDQHVHSTRLRVGAAEQKFQVYPRVPVTSMGLRGGLVLVSGNLEPAAVLPSALVGRTHSRSLQMPRCLIIVTCRTMPKPNTAIPITAHLRLIAPRA